MNLMSILDGSRLSLITREVDDELRRVRDVIANPVLVDGRGDVEEILSKLAGCGTGAPKTLDLIGHSTPDRSLLMLGDWVVDGSNSKVRSFFRGLVDAEILSRVGVRTIRLLGCETGVTDAGRETLVELSQITELEVSGTTQAIGAAMYGAAGFEAEHVLVSSNVLRRDPMLLLVKRGGEPFQRVLDIETLPASPLGPRPSYPRKLAGIAEARRLLALIRRAEGAQMPGLIEPPLLEIAIPSVKRNWWHRIQVFLDGDFIRVFPDGDDRPGVLFPVTDAAQLLALAAELSHGDA